MVATDFAERLKNLSPAKRALLVRAMRQDAARAEKAKSIPRRTQRESAPLSFAQQRLWFLAQLEPGSAAFNFPLAARLTGLLRVSILERCFNEIINRHEVLRTTFALVDDQPVQIINPVPVLSLAVESLAHLPAGKREEEARRLHLIEAQQPFDLEHGPLLRIRLLRLDEREHILLLTMHHIIWDGWSAGVFIKEISALYEAFAGGRPAPLEELPVQYADFAQWQRETLHVAALESHLNYWKRQLQDAPMCTLPTDRPRPALRGGRGARLPLVLSPSLGEAIRAFSRAEGVTPFMMLLTAFNLLLHRYTEQSEIVIGADVANRTHVETEKLIGFFVNQLVLRTDLSGNPGFRELLTRVRMVTLDAYAHQDVPFDKVVQVLKPERRPHQHPFYQVKIVFQNFPTSAVKLPGLTLQLLEMCERAPQLDLILFLRDSEQEIGGQLEYDTDLFDAATMRSLLRRFETLLGNIIAAPDTRINALEVFTREEMEQRRMETQELKQANRKKLAVARRKTVDLSCESPVTTGYLTDGETLPLVIRPAIEDVDLAEWVGRNRQFVEAQLLKHGAILWRGFDIPTVAAFERVALSLCPELYAENGELPRDNVEGKIYTPVKYPPNERILWHSENTFQPQWPMKIFFFCLTPAAEGGETPIADSRKVYQRIDPQIRERFRQRKITYVRNYGDGLGLDWQVVFQTADRAGAEAFCLQNGIEFNWKDGGRLRTRSTRPGVARHPKTGEMVWFNQATHWHFSCLDPGVREHLLATLAEDELPRNCYYGDGSPIANSEMRHICEVFQQSEVAFAWHKGDIMMLDNMLTAHARNPYAGEREIYVAMGDMLKSADLPEEEG